MLTLYANSGIGTLIKLYRTRGLNPCVRPMGRAAASPPCGVMDRDSTGETPSALCPPQEAGFTLNLMVIVLRVYEKQTLVNEALATGVSGFVLKKTAAWDLIPAIRYALQSRTYVSLTVR